MKPDLERLKAERDAALDTALATGAAVAARDAYYAALAAQEKEQDA